MKKITLLFFIFCLGFFELKGQTPELINYQAVARDVATGLPKINQTGFVRMTIRNSVGGTLLYQETHSGVTTNQFGLFTVKIGGGTPVTGTFASINWSTGNKFLEVEVDYGSGYENMGTTQLVSVPYALYAKEALNGPAGKNSLMNVTAIGNGGTCPNGGYQVDVGTDLDGSGILDAAEITGTFTVCNGDSGQSGAGINWLGTFATAPSNPNVNDAYYNSALGQSLIWDGTTWQIMAQDGSSGLTGGTGITIVGGVVNNTGDLDSLDDKINSAVLNGSTIEITEGSTLWSINLSSIINTNDTSATNEIQTISLSGNTITLSNGGGTVNISTTPPGASGEVLTWNGTSWVAQPLPVDNDSLANNEIITNFNVNVTNDSLVIDEAGNHFAVPLNSFNDGDWQKGSGIVFNTTDNIGIGIANPNYTLHVNSTDTVGIYTQGTNAMGTYNITQSLSNNMVGELYISGSDTVFKSLEPVNKAYFINYPKLGGGIYIAADSIKLFSKNNSKVNTVNLGDFYNKDTLKTNYFYLFDGAFTVGNVLTHIGGGRAVWQPLPGGSNLWVPNGNDMYNSNTGNIGIGTVAPFSTLDVNGQITMRTGAMTGYIPVSNANGTMTWTDPATISTADDGDWMKSAGAVYNTTDNIGIGTSSPLQKLHVNNGTLRVSDVTNYIDISQNGTTTDFIISNPLDISANGGSVGFSMDDGDAYFYINTHVNGQFQLSNGSEANGRILVSDATGVGTWTDPSTIPLGSAWLYNGTDIYNGNSGKVGVGISTPNALLHVQDVSSTAGDDLLNIGDFSGTAIVTVKDNGNVGIGLATPLNPLDIAHTAITPTNSAAHINYAYNGTGAGINSGLHIESKNGNGTDNVWGLYSNTTGIANTGMADIAVGAYSGATGAGDHIGIDAGAYSSSGDNYGGIFTAQATTTGSNYAIKAAASGGTNNWSGYFASGDVYVKDYVGIGTTTPTTSLHVNHPTGNTNGVSISNANDADKWHFYMFTTNDLTLYFNGVQRGAFDDVSGNYTATSDLRLKKNINSVSSVLDDVMKLNFVEYNYKGQKDNRKYFGYIAQEVEKVFPSLVYYQDESDLYLMDYSGFGSIAIKAIQEQQQMIDKQQEIIEELKKEIEALKNQK
ncbi:MAG: hypothetical protein Kow0079_08550 [Vicingaceae bacterium]